MSRPVPRALGLLAGGILLVSAVCASATQRTWNHASNGNWRFGANWTPAGPPQAGDTVVVNLAGTYTITMDSVATCRRLALGAGSGVQTVDFTPGSSLAMQAASDVLAGGAVRLAGASLSGSQITLAGSIVAHGTCAIGDSLVLNSGGLLRVEATAADGPAKLTLANAIRDNNGATVELTSTAAGNSELDCTALMTNLVGSQINLLPGAGGIRTLSTRLSSAGAINCLADSSLITSPTNGTSSSGFIRALGAGTGLTAGPGFTMTFSNSGGLRVGPGARLTLHGGTYSPVATTKLLNGSGTLIAENDTIQSGAVIGLVTDSLSVVSLKNVRITGSLPVVFSQATTVNANAVTGASAGNTTIAGTAVLTGACSWSRPITTSAGSTLRLLGTTASPALLTMTASDSIACSGLLELASNSNTDATLDLGTGRLHITPTGTLRSAAGGGGIRRVNGTLQNTGIVEGQANLTLGVPATASVTNDPGGRISVTADTLQVLQGASNVLTLNGALVASAGVTFRVRNGAATLNSWRLGAGKLSLHNLALTPPAGVLADTGTLELDSTQTATATTLQERGQLRLDRFSSPFVLSNFGTTVVHDTCSLGRLQNQAGAVLRLEAGFAPFGNGLLSVDSSSYNAGTLEMARNASSDSLQLDWSRAALRFDHQPGGVIHILPGGGAGYCDLLGYMNCRGNVVCEGTAIWESGGAPVDGRVQEFSGTTWVKGASGTVLSLGCDDAGSVLISGYLRIDTLNVAAVGSAPSGGGLLQILSQPGGKGQFQANYGVLTSPLVLHSDTVRWLDYQATISATTIRVGAAGAYFRDSEFTPGSRLFANAGITAFQGWVFLQDSLVVGPQGDLRVSGTSAGFTQIELDGPVRNRGLVELFGSGFPISVTLNGVTLLNQAGASLVRVNPGGLVTNLTGLIDNQGTIQIDGPTAWGPPGVQPLYNAGLLHLRRGNLEVGLADSLVNTGTVEIDSARTLTLSCSLINTGGGVLKGKGSVVSSVSPSVINDATISPGASPGILSLPGDVKLGGSGSLEMEIQGTTPGQQYDRLDVGGSADLGGALHVLVSPCLYTPPPGATYRVMNWASHTGTFGSITASLLGSGLSVVPTYTATGLDLTVQGVLQNHPPVAVNDVAAALPGAQVIPVLRNDSDEDGDSLRVVSVVTAPLHGTAQVGAGDTTLVYQPAGAPAPDSLRYSVRDCRGGLDTATVLISTAVGVGEILPATYRLGLPRPNPSRGSVALEYAMPRTGNGRLRIFDVTGRQVRTLFEGVQAAGLHTVTWDGRDQQGRATGAGTYFARLDVDGNGGPRAVLVQRMVRLH